MTRSSFIKRYHREALETSKIIFFTIEVAYIFISIIYVSIILFASGETLTNVFPVPTSSREFLTVLTGFLLFPLSSFVICYAALPFILLGRGLYFIIKKGGK